MEEESPLSLTLMLPFRSARTGGGAVSGGA